MKKWSKLVASTLILLTFLFMDCSKSNDPAATTTTTTPSVVGMWKLSSMQTANCTSALANSPETSCGTINCVVVVYTATTVTYQTQSGITGNIPVPYTISGNTMTLTYNGVTSSFTFTVTATTLTLIGNNYSYLAFLPIPVGCKQTDKYTKQ